MKTRFKILIAFIMVIVIMGNACIISSANDQQTWGEIDEQEYVSYAEGAAIDYVNSIHPEYNNISISRPYRVENGRDTRIRVFFIFSNNQYIGELYVGVVDNQFTATYFDGIEEEIRDAFRERKEFSIYTNNLGNYIIYLDGEYINLSTKSISDKLVETRIQYPHSFTNSYGHMGVPFVVNEEAPSGAGLCWAATASMIGSYTTNSPAISALSLYNQLDSIYSGTPQGNNMWIIRAYLYFGYTTIATSSSMSYYTTKSILQTNKPIHARMESSSSGYVHGVVINGYKEETTNSNTYLKYEIVDSNRVTGSFYVGVNSSTGFFSFTSADVVFDNWIASFRTGHVI